MSKTVRLLMRCVITATVLVTASHSQPARPDDPNGTWLTEDGRARIRIERCGATLDQICGYIVWMNESVGANGQPLRDRHNPDPNKRFRLLLGHQLIMGMTQTVEGRFSGQIYNAENGSFYKIALWRDTSDRLKVKGCMLTVFCATQTWTQTTDVLPGQLIGLTGDVNGPKADKEWMPPKRPRSAGSLR